MRGIPTFSTPANDDDADRRESREGFGEDPLDIGAGGDIGADGDRLDSELFDVSHGGFRDGRVTDVVDDNVCAEARIAQGNGLADSTSRAGDDGGLAS